MCAQVAQCIEQRRCCLVSCTHARSSMRAHCVLRMSLRMSPLNGLSGDCSIVVFSALAPFDVAAPLTSAHTSCACSSSRYCALVCARDAHTHIFAHTRRFVARHEFKCFFSRRRTIVVVLLRWHGQKEQSQYSSTWHSQGANMFPQTVRRVICWPCWLRAASTVT